MPALRERDADTRLPGTVTAGGARGEPKPLHQSVANASSLGEGGTMPANTLEAAFSMDSGSVNAHIDGLHWRIGVNVADSSGALCP